MMRPSQFGPFLRGVHAETDPYTIPKGAVSRASNLIMTDRGALTDCDGTGIINAFSGAVQNNRGRILAECMFQPTGVSPYYLAIAKAPDKPLGAPQAVTTSDGGAGGGLTPSVTYDYVIVAIDGAGGTTQFSTSVPYNQIGVSHKTIVTWNIVPNAYAYIVYRNKSTQNPFFRILVGAGLPVAQPVGATTVTWTDDGSVPDPFSTSIAVTTVVQGRSNQEAVFQLASSAGFFSGFAFTYNAGSDASYDNPYVTLAVLSPTTVLASTTGSANDGGVGTGGNLTQQSISSIGSDTTSQTVLFKMPSFGAIPISYSNSNIVAYFPPSPSFLGTPPPGYIGTNAGGIDNSTPSGGIPGLTSLTPQMVQFTNRIVIALGNGYAPQIYWDSSGSLVNPAPTKAITGIAVDANGVVTVTTSGLSITDPTSTGFIPVGSTVILSGVNPSIFNGVFVVTSVNTGAGTYTLTNVAAIGSAYVAGGTWTVSVTPITNTFVPAYPKWAASSSYGIGSVVQPNGTPETYYFKATQGGVSGAGEPTWTNAATLGQQISDGTIIWTNQGSQVSSAPAPPGAGHVIIYSGTLWAWNTSPTNTTAGIDGPCSLRMSDVNNPFSWNPINQAFLDKDDGTEGMGLATFTISAEGIPPEGSLVAYKNYAGYQIVGIFGSSNFSIQRIRSDMGCFAPRSIWFVPGYGIARYSHLGVALFDGVRDTVISEEMRPYLFTTNDTNVSDITVADAAWIPVSQGCLTANPPMYVLAIPIGTSSGALTRILNYDLVLKCWGGPIDLPFSISSMTQVRPVTSNPITLFGGYLDGVLQRWQGGDVQWYTGIGGSATAVNWSFQTPEAFSDPADQKLHWRRLTIRGVATSGNPKVTVTPYINGTAKPSQSYTVPVTGDFEVFAGIRREGLRFSAKIAGTGHLEISRVDYHMMPKAVGVPSVCS